MDTLLPISLTVLLFGLIFVLDKTILRKQVKSAPPIPSWVMALVVTAIVVFSEKVLPDMPLAWTALVAGVLAASVFAIYHIAFGKRA